MQCFLGLVLDEGGIDTVPVVLYGTFNGVEIGTRVIGGPDVRYDGDDEDPDS